MIDHKLVAFYAVRALALADLNSASDDEIRAEILDDEIDPDQLAANIAATLDEVVAAQLREHGALAKSEMRSAATPKQVVLPTLERIKATIAAAFASDPQLATAYREGTKQAEIDLVSLYEDLVLLGKIPPDSDAN